MNQFLLVTILFAVAACATPSLEPNRSESVQAMESGGDELESGGDELLVHNDQAEKFERIEEIEAPNVSETPAEMIPHMRVAEPEIICERVVPTGSRLSVEVCRRRSDIARKQDANQKLFDDIKRNTAIGASRL